MTRPHSSEARVPAELAAPTDTTLPNGLAVELAADVRRSCDGAIRDHTAAPLIPRLALGARHASPPGAVPRPSGYC
jgi:hypothetical protein